MNEQAARRLLRSLAGERGGSLIATPRAESLPRRSRLPAVRTRQSNGSAQGKVEKKSEQVGDERCDQCPEDGRHAAPSSICIDIAQAENPDCAQQSPPASRGRAPWQQNREPGGDLTILQRRMLPDKADQHHRRLLSRQASGFNGLRNDIQELTNAHWDNPFSFIQPADNRCRMGNSRQKHKDGTIHKASNPKCMGAGCR